MSKINEPIRAAGVIAEYNPFHSGHRYHLQLTKARTGAPFCAVAMSGSFVQRGEPAVFDKYVRTRMALLNGADAVFEIPAPFSAASAKEFAGFGVRLLDALGAVDSLCFGSECGSLAPLEQMAGLLCDEPPEFKDALQAGLREGMSFPKARALAARAVTAQAAGWAADSPNDILGIEYLRALKETGSPMKPFTIRRADRGYHDLSTDGELASASAIRRLLTEGAAAHGTDSPDASPLDTALPRLVPADTLPLIRRELPLTAEAFAPLLDYKIGELLHREGTAGLERYEDVSPELAARIACLEPGHQGFSARIAGLKTKQVTYTRVSRALTHLLLDITKEDTAAYKAAGFAPYARLLGFRRDAAPLLSEIKRKSRIPVVTKLADAKNLLSPTALRLLEQEIYASHLYQTVKQQRFGGEFKNEYRQPVVIL